MSDSPITDALVQRHTDETLALETRWPEGEFVDRHEWKRHALRQAQELLDHARRLERDRKELIKALLELLKWAVDSNTMKSVLTLHAIHGGGPTEETPMIIKAIADARALLSRMEKT